ncbi:molecular chaperone DnaJ [Hymenobacter taeanensis]|uniref:Molecular chaperone DnaJ n=1 Tax=Hymenobacter taeanensis TaxID=2735321 RepID=A0A6M6BII5_9BACT|nr:molecular chaperone DnaJ [Hymenobacter taeanensis]QJX47829.1 molecular chaperone DnaJ [Hymenobacter taeanensis]
MKNPYEVLGLTQEASNEEINLGFKEAVKQNIKSRLHTQAELMTARQQLLSPARRLAADFLYPVRPKAKRPRKLTWPTLAEVNLDLFNSDAHDSL